MFYWWLKLIVFINIHCHTWSGSLNTEHMANAGVCSLRFNTHYLAEIQEKVLPKAENQIILIIYMPYW